MCFTQVSLENESRVLLEIEIGFHETLWQRLETPLKMFFHTETWNNGVWHDLSKSLPLRMEELLSTGQLATEDVPDLELHADVLLAADSSGSHKQFQNKDIGISSRNIELGTFELHYIAFR